MMLEDKKTFVNTTWHEYEPYIRKLCAYKLKSMPEHIDDCIQDVFLALSEYLNKEKTIEYPKAWLTKVANNKIKDIYSQVKKQSDKIVPFESQNLDNTYSCVVYDEHFSIDDEQIQVIKENIINLLDEKEQRLLYDRYKLKKTIPVIAKEHNTTENNVYQKLFRLKQKTKMLIEKVLNE